MLETITTKEEERNGENVKCCLMAFWNSSRKCKINRKPMYGLHRNHLPPKKRSAVNRDVVRYPGPALKQAQRGGRPVKQTTDPNALKKITVLESELLKLRAQIAMIVTAAPASGTHCLYFFSQHKQMLFSMSYCVVHIHVIHFVPFY